MDPEAPHVQAFWEVLREMTPEERTDFLRFAWARSRMPASGAFLRLLGVVMVTGTRWTADSPL